MVTFHGGRPTSLPAQIPTTIEGITAAPYTQRTLVAELKFDL